MGVLESSLGHLGWNLEHLGRVLEPLSDVLEPSWGVLGRSWEGFGRSWRLAGTIWEVFLQDFLASEAIYENIEQPIKTNGFSLIFEVLGGFRPPKKSKTKISTVSAYPPQEGAEPSRRRAAVRTMGFNV